ncbi:MAG: hypothetical protein KatS3mg105_2412 [Gemmatales bacterium]|nr:MAG: hypothetical protein KatS3mg105_2412 [Gemmatales bacterium]
MSSRVPTLVVTIALVLTTSGCFDSTRRPTLPRHYTIRPVVRHVPSHDPEPLVREVVTTKRKKLKGVRLVRTKPEPVSEDEVAQTDDRPASSDSIIKMPEPLLQPEIPSVPPPPATVIEDPLTPPPIPSVVKTPTATGSTRTDDLQKLRELYREARAEYDSIGSYICRLRRREQVNGKDKPEELLLFKFRKNPWSVYFKWLGIEGHGREVVYVKGQYEDKIHTLLAAGDVPLMPAGKQIALPPDSVLVRSASRHTIYDAGIGSLVDRFGRYLDSMETGQNRYGTMKYVGKLKRPEFNEPFDAVEQDIPPGAEAGLPKGGSRLWLFSPKNHLPLLVITRDHTGHEVEYYCYDRLQYPVKLDDHDFNPALIWRKKS